MAKERTSSRVTASFRVDPVLLKTMRTLIRDQAGAPLYLDRAGFIESAIRNEMDRIEQRLLHGVQRKAEPVGNGSRR